MYNLSVAQIQFLTVDNTHTKYLKGKDKKAWNDYHSIIKAQESFEGFLNGLASGLKEGEEKEIPVG